MLITVREAFPQSEVPAASYQDVVVGSWKVGARWRRGKAIYPDAAKKCWETEAKRRLNAEARKRSGAHQVD